MRDETEFAGSFRERIVSGGFIDARQLVRLIAEAELHLAKPDSYVIHPLFFQAWGRKPNDLARDFQRDVARVARRQPQPEVTGLDQFRRHPGF